MIIPHGTLLAYGMV